MSYYSDASVTLYHGDCLAVMAGLPPASVDSVVTDPPYGLGFMGREWDALPPGEPWARECLRVLKPGGHLLAFGGTRTWHRLAVAVEDAGFEIRDSIAWLYGSGFPKSLDVSKAIDRAAGAERAVIGVADRKASLGSTGVLGSSNFGEAPTITAAASETAQRWHGWGTALKPAFEPIIVARKPLVGTVAANVLTHGTGALNIDGCRVATPTSRPLIASKTEASTGIFGDGLNGSSAVGVTTAGRWPTNVVLSDDQAAELDRQSGVSVSRIGNPRGAGPGDGWGMTATGSEYADEGGASRFFPTFRYEAKAPATERPRMEGVAHPTVKPLGLMRWLARLVTPPGGLVLDPFAGSGTTAEACVHEHMRCIAIEREAAYLLLIVARLSKPMQVRFDFGGVA